MKKSSVLKVIAFTIAGKEVEDESMPVIKSMDLCSIFQTKNKANVCVMMRRGSCSGDLKKYRQYS